ncbi:MAG: branched-chain amino acid ABC transporter substrate-binding protein [bacterium]
MRRIKIATLIFVVCAISFVFIGGCAKKKAGVTVIKIGLIVPLTGDIAAMGQGMKNGATLAVEQANEREDVRAKGLSFEVVPVDDRADPKEAVNGANMLISDSKVMGVVGHLNSQCSIPASQVYARKDLVMISPASTNPKLTQQGLRNVFRVCTTDNVQGSFGAEYVYNRRKFMRVAVMHDKTTYGQGLAEEFRKRFEEIGGAVLSFDGINFGDRDFKAVLTRIKSRNPQAIYYGGMYSEAGLITKQAKELGFNVPLIGGDGIFSPEYMKIGGKATEGDIATMIGAPPEELDTAKKFIEDYRRRFPNVAFQPYDAYTFDAAGIIIDAVMNAGTSRKGIVDYVHKIKYQGVIGETQFDEKGDTLNKTITVYTVRGGKFVTAD